MDERINAEWLEDAFAFLFDMFDDEELKELEVIETVHDLMAATAAVQYADDVYPLVKRNMTEIPVNIVTSSSSKKSIISKNKVSAYKGCLILHVSKTKEEDKDFGLSAYMELWLLEDGRFAEITCIQFETEGFVTLRREFKRIVKRRNHLFFSINDLEDALEDMELTLFMENMTKEEL